MDEGNFDAFVQFQAFQATTY